MNPLRVLAPALLAVALSMAAPSPSRAAWPHDPGVNLPVCTATDAQYTPVITSDGAGGAIIAWYDNRSGFGQDIYAQHVLASGVADPAWPVNGRALCTATNDQIRPTIVSDGAGGAIVTWADYRLGTDFDIYAQHVLSSGAVDPAWPANGRAVCSAANDQYTPTIAADGAGGAIISWVDNRPVTNTDVYAQHILSTGVIDAAWPVNGRALCTATDTQNGPVIVSDGSGGAIVAWQDYRSGTNPDIYAQHVFSTGAVDPSWFFNGVAVCVQPFEQLSPSILADGAGGAILTWYDFRNGSNNDIYAQHVRSVNGVDTSWPANGTLVCGAANAQWNPTLVSDGSGGAIVCWFDYRSGVSFDVYAQHVLGSGAVDGAWPADGRALCTAPLHQTETTIVPDGAGGAIVSWSDVRSAIGFDVYAQHVGSSGAVDPNWPVNGRALSTAGGDQQTPVSVSDGAGGAIVAWVDSRAGYPDIYAQRIARFGLPGTPEPEIASVRDVPNDQGGRAKLSWYASWVDTNVDPFSSIYEVNLYEVWRSVPAAAAAAVSRSGARVQTSFAEPPADDARTFVVMPAGAQIYAWEYLASQNAAHYIPAYSYLAPTAGDSIGTYNPKTVFMVVARNTSGSKYWLSRPDSGYSVDNLAPAAPAPFTGNYGGGATHLHWNPNPEPDLANYRLYRGNSAGFVPGPSNLIASPPDTGHVDAGAAGGYYKLSAVDVHGNESGFALLTPATTGGVGEGGELALALARPSPNPASEVAALSYTLAREARVRLALFDLAGRRVRRLVDGAVPAGDHALVWDLRDDAGTPVRGGLYFVRIEAEHRALTRRLTIAR